MSSKGTDGLRLWEVVVPAHTVQRWQIPARTLRVGELSEDGARRLAARFVHIDAGVPPFRSFVAATVKLATARRVVDERRGYVPERVR